MGKLKNMITLHLKFAWSVKPSSCIMAYYSRTVARTGVYRVSPLAYYVVMEHSTIFTGIGDVDMRSFHLAYYMVMEHSTRFTGIGDVDMRSFHLAYYVVMEHSTTFTELVIWTRGPST